MGDRTAPWFSTAVITCVVHQALPGSFVFATIEDEVFFFERGVPFLSDGGKNPAADRLIIPAGCCGLKLISVCEMWWRFFILRVMCSDLMNNRCVIIHEFVFFKQAV